MKVLAWCWPDIESRNVVVYSVATRTSASTVTPNAMKKNFVTANREQQVARYNFNLKPTAINEVICKFKFSDQCTGYPDWENVRKIVNTQENRALVSLSGVASTSLKPLM